MAAFMALQKPTMASRVAGTGHCGSLRTQRPVATSSARGLLQPRQRMPLGSSSLRLPPTSASAISKINSSSSPAGLPALPLRSSFLGSKISLSLKPVASNSKAQDGCFRIVTKCEATKAGPLDALVTKFKSTPALETGFYFFMWYFLNVIFNIINKKVYGFFPFPWVVSVVHLGVGAAYCLIAWALNAPKREILSKQQILDLVPVAACHAMGHVAANISFSLVAVSFTHTIKALEPFFAVLGSIILGDTVSVPIMLSLLPIVGGVAAASLTELSFNWAGFWSAMFSNLTFTYRNIFSKKAMASVKTLDSVNLYAYITLLSLALLIPPTLIIEGPQLVAGWSAAVAKVGLTHLVQQLLLVGFFYHTYNQVAYQALEKVNPVTYAIGNVLKRVFVIGFSIIVFGNKITAQTAAGTAVALAGVTYYSLEKANEKKPKAPPPETPAPAPAA